MSPGKKGYSSKAQQRYMHAKHPGIAKKMDAETKSFKRLPQHVKKKKSKKKR